MIAVGFSSFGLVCCQTCQCLIVWMWIFKYSFICSLMVLFLESGELQYFLYNMAECRTLDADWLNVARHIHTNRSVSFLF